MAFKNVQKTLSAAEVSVYTAPASTDGIVFTGVISNTDSDTESIVFCSLKLKQGSTSTFIIKDVPIVYGGSLSLPKIVVKSTGEIIAFASNPESANHMDITLGILEQAE